MPSGLHLLSAVVLTLVPAMDIRAEEATPLQPVSIVGDAIPASLTGGSGDAARGRAIVLDRTRGLCLLCHSGPFPEERFQGDIGPDLSGVGQRRSEGQLRLRLVDGRRLDRDTIMPAYYSLDGLSRVAASYRGRAILGPGEIEDVVAFLVTLREAPDDRNRR